jgi:hypothetical protein
MNLETLDVPGAWLLSSRQFEDDRGNDRFVYRNH